MRDFTFHNPVTAIMGESALEKLSELSANQKVLLVFGGSSARANGTLRQVEDAITSRGGTVVEYDGVTQCTHEAIELATGRALAWGATMVVGLGGASAMDTAKAVAFCALHPDYDAHLRGELPQNNDEKLPLVLIPTYPSTGSEANGVSDIMGFAGGIHGVFADYALLHPPFTYSLDQRNTAFSTMVMLAQTGYRFFTDGNPVSRGYTAAGLRAVLDAYAMLLDDPRNYDARAVMLWASFMETSGVLGLSIEDRWPYSIFSTAGLLRFTLGTVYRENLAMILPRWLVFAARHHLPEVRQFAVEVLGASPDGSSEAILRTAFDRLMDVLRSGNLPTTLSAYGVLPSFEEVEAAAKRVSSKEFSVAEYYEMLSACETEEFPGL